MARLRRSVPLGSVAPVLRGCVGSSHVVVLLFVLSCVFFMLLECGSASIMGAGSNNLYQRTLPLHPDPSRHRPRLHGTRWGRRSPLLLPLSLPLPVDLFTLRVFLSSAEPSERRPRFVRRRHCALLPGLGRHGARVRSSLARLRTRGSRGTGLGALIDAVQVARFTHFCSAVAFFPLLPVCTRTTRTCTRRTTVLRCTRAW